MRNRHTIRLKLFCWGRCFNTENVLLFDFLSYAISPSTCLGEDDWVKVSGHDHRWKKITVNDLIEGKSYFFRVSAVNSAGRGMPAVIPDPVNVGIILGITIVVFALGLYILMCNFIQ